MPSRTTIRGVIACLPINTHASAGIGGRLRGQIRQEQAMLDVILIVTGLGFFALCIIYAFGCEHL